MSTKPDTAAQTHDRRPDLALAAGIILAAVLLVAFRYKSFCLPLETDECNYAYIGARLLDGARIYVDVWDHQPFGVFALFAGVIGVFGDSPEVIRWMAVAFSLVSLAFIGLLLKRTGGRAAALVGVLLFAVVSSDPGTAGEGCNREIYMNTLILGAWYLAVCSPSNRRLALLLAGVALGLGSAIKTIVAIHWLALLFWVTIVDRPKRPVSQRMIDVALLAAGPLVLWLGSLGYFAVTGRASEFIDAVFVFNLGYSESDAGLFGRFAQFFTPDRHPYIFDSAIPLWIVGGAGTAWLILRSFMADTANADDANTEAAAASVISRSHAAAIALLVLASFVAVCLPGRFWPHYYYLLVPPLVLACSLVAMQFARWAGRPIHCQAGPGAIVVHVLSVLLVIGPSLVLQYQDYLSQDPLGITVKRYNSRDFWGRAHGLKVKSVTDPGDSIFVFGSDVAIYYYSQRRCASRYTMITGLADNMPGAEKRRETLLKDLRANMPRLILVMFDQKPFPAWLERHGSNSCTSTIVSPSEWTSTTRPVNRSCSCSAARTSRFDRSTGTGIEARSVKAVPHGNRRNRHGTRARHRNHPASVAHGSRRKTPRAATGSHEHERRRVATRGGVCGSQRVRRSRGFLRAPDGRARTPRPILAIAARCEPALQHRRYGSTWRLSRRRARAALRRRGV